jgi:hypothetical protein
MTTNNTTANLETATEAEGGAASSGGGGSWTASSSNNGGSSAVAANASKARAILERKIEQGRTSAADLLSRIESDVPTDTLVRGGALEFIPNGAIKVRLGEGEVLGVHHHALGQMATRAGIPGAYLADLGTEEGWQRELACEILNRHYREGVPATRFLARSIRGEMRGFLSDHYRRLDSRPLVDAFAAECQAVGAVPVDGTVTDTRVALKAILPEIYEPVPGEVLAFGVEWHNSDFGAGAHALRAFMLRVWCLNGATMENALAQVHLGGRLSEAYDLSQRTYRLDTAASKSALRDVVRGVLAAPAIEVMCNAIRSANEKHIDWKNVKNAVGRRLLKGELEAAQAAFEGADTINLPAGRTAWRASNALSWIAGHTESADRKLDLERLAGELVSGHRGDEIAAD